MAVRLERCFHSVVAENLADTECVLRQHSDNLLQRDNFDVHLDVRVLPARKMTLIVRAWFAEGFTRKKINLDHARMELRDLREIHAVRPHCFQRHVDDDFLLGSQRWLQILPRISGERSFEVTRTRLIWPSQIAQHYYAAKPGHAEEVLSMRFVADNGACGTSSSRRTAPPTATGAGWGRSPLPSSVLLLFYLSIPLRCAYPA